MTHKCVIPTGIWTMKTKPRMDYDTYTNLVSDVRIKRYIRDYLEIVKEKPIFVTANAKDAKDRNAQIKKENLNILILLMCGCLELSQPKKIEWVAILPEQFSSIGLFFTPC